MSAAEKIADNMAPFRDPELTRSALRTLAFIELRELEAAMERGDHDAAQNAAYAVLQTIEKLETRTAKDEAA